MSRDFRNRILPEIRKLETQAKTLTAQLDRLRSTGKNDDEHLLLEARLGAIDAGIFWLYQQYAQSFEDEKEGMLISVGELLNKEFSDQLWLVEGMVPKNGLTAISGVPGAYKSWLSLYMAKCVSGGELFLGQRMVEKGRVLIVDLENSEPLRQRRCREIGLHSESDVYYWQGDFSVEDRSKYELLRSVIKARGIGLVVFDSLVRIHSADENDARSMSRVFKKLKKLTLDGVAVVFLHHSRKQSFQNRGGAGESMRGSSDILAAIDSHLLIVKDSNGLTLSQPKLRQAEPVKPMKIKVNSGEKFEFEFIGEAIESIDKLTQAREGIVELLQDKTLERQEIIASLIDIGSGSVDKALKGLMAEKEIYKKIGANNRHFYSLSNYQEAQASFMV